MVLEKFKKHLRSLSIEGMKNQISKLINLRQASRDIREEEFKKLISDVKELEEMYRMLKYDEVD